MREQARWRESRLKYNEKQAGLARLAPPELAIWSWLSIRLACFLADYQKVLAPNHPG